MSSHKVSEITEEQRLRQNEYQRKWKAEHADIVKQWACQDYVKNRDKRCAAERDRRASNPEKARAYDAKRRATHAKEVAESRRKYYHANREEILAREKKRNAANPGIKRHNSQLRYWKDPKAALARHRLKKYGLTNDMFLDMRARQHERCASCGKPFSELTKAPAVDHDHKTGIVRGLLCTGCNFAVGHSGDSPSRLRSCADYLERASKSEAA